MTDNETGALVERVNGRIQEIAAAQKGLKRASVLPVIERRNLAARLAQAQARLEELRSGLTGGEDGADAGTAEGAGEAPGEDPSDVESALTEAEAVLAQVAEATHPGAGGPSARVGWRPGERRGW